MLHLYESEDLSLAQWLRWQLPRLILSCAFCGCVGSRRDFVLKVMM